MAQKNDTTFPVKGSGGQGDDTYVCTMVDGCCFNPGEDKDENAVVRDSALSPTCVQHGVGTAT